MMSLIVTVRCCGAPVSCCCGQLGRVRMTSQVAGEGVPRVSLPLTGLYQTHECHASLSHTLQFSQLGQQQFFDQLTIFLLSQILLKCVTYFLMRLFLWLTLTSLKQKPAATCYSPGTVCCCCHAFFHSVHFTVSVPCVLAAGTVWVSISI